MALSRTYLNNTCNGNETNILKTVPSYFVTTTIATGVYCYDLNEFHAVNKILVCDQMHMYLQ